MTHLAPVVVLSAKWISKHHSALHAIGARQNPCSAFSAQCGICVCMFMVCCHFVNMMKNSFHRLLSTVSMSMVTKSTKNACHEVSWPKSAAIISPLKTDHIGKAPLNHSLAQMARSHPYKKPVALASAEPAATTTTTTTASSATTANSANT